MTTRARTAKATATNPMTANTAATKATPDLATEYQEIARDCAGLLTLLHRLIADDVAVARTGTIHYGHLGSLGDLRDRLYQALIPRHCPANGCEKETRQRLASLVREVRPARV
jgi:hypothetical protein